MKITCDNCGAVYKIPEDKLTREVSRATCKKCNSKIIIRRPGQGDDSYEDMRHTGSAGDDDPVINHEERTVIAQVPELQKFDATPPLASSQPQEELMGLLSGAHARGHEARGHEHAPPRSHDAPKVNTTPMSRSAAAVARDAMPIAPVQPTITATTSPPPPSGQAASPASAPQANSSLGALAQASAPKANVVDIFAQSGKDSVGTVAPELRQPASKLPLILLGIALIGVLSFIDKGLWGLTLQTAIGFFVSLYCILAAFFTQLDLIQSGKINFVKVIVIPAVLCAALLTVLWSLQKENVAFLHPEVDPKLLIDYIAALPDNPEAEQDASLPIEERMKKYQQKRRPRSTQQDPMVRFDPAKLSRPGQTDTETNLRSGDNNSALISGGVPGVDSGFPSSRRDVEVGSKLASLSRKQEVVLDADAINTVVEKSGAKKCLTTYIQGMNLPSKMDLRLELSSDGSLKSASLDDVTFRGSKAEQCMIDGLRSVKFPTFESATGNAQYSYPIVR